MADGTLLNTGVGGDLISDEDMTGTPRLSATVPQLASAQAGYKIERTKIAIGPYDQDRGDVDIDARALPVETAAERRLLEATAALTIDHVRLASTTRQRERAPALVFNARIGRAGRDGI